MKLCHDNNPEAGVAKLAPGDKLKGRIDHIGEMTLNVAAEK